MATMTTTTITNYEFCKPCTQLMLSMRMKTENHSETGDDHNDAYDDSDTKKPAKVCQGERAKRRTKNRITSNVQPMYG